MNEHGFPYRLVLLRHGQSEWNAAGIFTGWENAHLTAHGELQAARAGEQQFMAWRRGFRVRPPLGEPDDDPRYAALPPDARPRGESLYDVTARLLPYWYDAVVRDLHRHGCVLVVSHGNTLRALVKHLDGVSDAASAGLEVPNAVPVCYAFRAGRVTRLARPDGTVGRG